MIVYKSDGKKNKRTTQGEQGVILLFFFEMLAIIAFPYFPIFTR